MMTLSQIYTEIEKQKYWMKNSPKQKEYIELYTWRCEPSVKQKINVDCSMWPVPELLYMEFTLTNDHIEREESEYKPFEIDLNFNLN